MRASLKIPRSSNLRLISTIVALVALLLFVSVAPGASALSEAIRSLKVSHEARQSSAAHAAQSSAHGTPGGNRQANGTSYQRPGA